jgi:hypothetical protein
MSEDQSKTVARTALWVSVAAWAVLVFMILQHVNEERYGGAIVLGIVAVIPMAIVYEILRRRGRDDG